ncbi:MAG TPA: cation:proton antiporter [Acidimicrobiales bacterium]|nr:cation:proton antiporter [Acidimicrobiales bacterium]
MVTVLVFAATLAIAVLVSQLAHRTVLSTAVLFLAAGFVAGPGVLGVDTLTPSQPAVHELADLALFSVLFTDGMGAGIGELRRAWRLPGRALLFGMPLTLAAIALLARYVGGLGWTDAFLLGAVLSPTDPVFAAALVGREGVPARLRQLLNVESGLNDGLALPVVVVLLAVSSTGPVNAAHLGTDLALGVVLGVVVPWGFICLEQSRLFSASALYEPLGMFAVGLGLLAICRVTGANEFLAGFVGGITTASVSTSARDAFHRFGELVTELLKLAALLAFGALVTPALLGGVGVGGWIFAIAAITLARPAALTISLYRSSLPWQERASAAWFGPKGFASVVYGLMVLESRNPLAERIFALTVVAVAISIVAHSSSDILVAGWLERDTST